jgi:hypothetical protein
MPGVDRRTIRRYTTLAVALRLEPSQGAAGLTEERLASFLLALETGTGRPHGEGWKQCVAQRAFIEQKIKSKVTLSKCGRNSGHSLSPIRILVIHLLRHASSISTAHTPLAFSTSFRMIALRAR